MLSDELKRCTPERAQAVFERALTRSEDLINKAGQLINEFSTTNGLDTSCICFVAVGSIGRKEALEASDFDLIPIAASREKLEYFQPYDKLLRDALIDRLCVKVSRGEDLTKAASVCELTEPDCIGGIKDSSGALTKRILVLTESQQVSGGLSIECIRRSILDAYAKEDRTSGRHVLSFCNDIARYYKTLCIEYKAKIDDEEKDWCTRNIKLRYSRKFWYFANILAIAMIAEIYPLGSDAYVDELLNVFNVPPIERMTMALCKVQPMELGRLLESYSMFLQFMSRPENRAALASVEHDKRYEMELANPFPAMKFNSDIMHSMMTSVLDGLSSSMRNRVISWFLL